MIVLRTFFRPCGVIALLMAIVLALQAGSVRAATTNWIGATGDVWSDPANWDNGLPTGQNVIVQGGAYSPVLTGDDTVSMLGVGDSATGTMTQNGGNLTVGGDFYLAGNSSTGYYTMNGGSISVGGSFVVGNGGFGSFTQTGGTVTSTGYMALGNWNWIGSVDNQYDLSSGTLNVNELRVGVRGSGTLTVRGNGVLNSAANSYGISMGHPWAGAQYINSTINLQDNGTINARSGLQLTADSSNSGTLNQSGGTLNVTTLSRGPGNGYYNFSGGTLNAAAVEGMDLYNNGGVLSPGGHGAIGKTVIGLTYSNDIALGGTATQQSTDWGGVASRAIDGNTNGNWGNNSVTHTQDNSNNPQPWWQVDLGSMQAIGAIQLWNRTDYGPDRLSNFSVSVLDASNNVVWSNSFFTGGGYPNPNLMIQPPAGVTGQIVKVQLNGSGILSLAEVQVFDPSRYNYIQNSASALVIDIAPTFNAADQLVAGGVTLYGGALTINKLPNQGFHEGQSFKIIDAASISGVFDTTTLPTLQSWLQWNTSELYTKGTISVELNGNPLPPTGSSTWALPGSGTWYDTPSWSGGIIPNGVGQTANFLGGLTSDAQVGVDGPKTVGTLHFDNASYRYTIQGVDLLTLQTATGTPTINVAGGNHTISAPLLSNQGLNKTGTGTIQLLGANTLNGAVQIQAGKLVLGSYNATGTGNTLQVAGGATLELNGQNTGVNLTCNLLGAGNINQVSPAGAAFSGDNSNYSGTVTHTNGWIAFGSANAGSAQANWVNNAYLGITADGANIQLGSLSGAVGALLAGNTWSNAVDTFTIGGNNASTTYAGGITDHVVGGEQATLAIAKVGSGSLKLSGPLEVTDTRFGARPVSGSNFSGDITVQNGTLIDAAISVYGGSAWGLPSSARTITVNAGGTMVWGAPNIFGGHWVTSVPTLVINGGTVTNADIADGFDHSGDPAGTVYSHGTNNALNNLVLNNGTLTSTTGCFSTVDTPNPSVPGWSDRTYGAWDINGTVTSHGNSRITTTAAANGQIMLASNGPSGGPFNTTFDVQDGVLTVSANLIDGDNGIDRSGLLKIGTGTMTITAQALYHGDTVVNGGTLNVNELTTSPHISVIGPDTVLTATSLVCDTLTISSTSVATVPEPSMVILLAFALVASLGFLKRRK